MSATDNQFAAQFLDDYFAECDEHLTVIRREVLTLESHVGQSVVDRTRFDELFRSLHSIKGLSGMVEMREVEELTHHLESYLRSLHDETVGLTPAGYDVLLAGTRAVEEVIKARRTNAPTPDISPLVARIRAQNSSSVKTPAAVLASPIQNAEAAAQLATAQQSGPPVWRFEFTPAVALAERAINVNSIRVRLQGIGALLHAAPLVSAGGAITFEFLVATAADAKEFVSWAADGLTWAPYEAPKPPAFASPGSDQGKAPGAASRATPLLTPANMVRVDLARLDELMQMVGDLVISRSRLDDNLRRIEALLPAEPWRTLQETNQALERQLRNLREGVMRVRLVPIGDVFSRLQFMIRDLAREHEKKIAIALHGQETEIDKYLVDRLMDPLLHLIRNAVSHGLETADERLAQGKSPEGTITLRAATAGETIVLEVEDDGRGIDPALVVTKARALGMLDGAATLEGPALLDMLCRPGFTTCTQADRISGRGVGMDVVKTAIQELGGSFLLDSRPGQGARFTIHLPLTLAIADALIAGVGDQAFAIPQASVQEVMPLPPGAATVLENNEIVSHRGRVLPLMRLARVFGLADAPVEVGRFALVVGNGIAQVALVVDRILGQREIVVRTLADPLVQVPGIVGATELGDGRAVLILDVPSLIRAVQRSHLSEVSGAASFRNGSQRSNGQMPPVGLPSPGPAIPVLHNERN